MLSFTVTRRGEPITFSTLHTLESASEALAQSRSEFAIDLRIALANGRLTRKQAPWLLFLAEESAPTVVTEQKPAGEFQPLLDAVTRMQEQANQAANDKGRKAGKVTLRFVGAQVSAVIDGPNTGCLYVKADGCYMGKVTKDGEFRRAYGVDEAPVLEALRAAQQDPTGAAIAYGRETGVCSCCGRDLTNKRSIELGIGPICLDKLGGAWL